MFLWANLQAGFLAGLAALGVWTVACFVEKRDRLLALIITLASAGVGLLNAYGWDLYSYTLRAITSNTPDRQYVQGGQATMDQDLVDNHLKEQG